jgi:hypothetical protein
MSKRLQLRAGAFLLPKADQQNPLLSAKGGILFRGGLPGRLLIFFVRRKRGLSAILIFVEALPASQTWLPIEVVVACLGFWFRCHASLTASFPLKFPSYGGTFGATE